LCGNTACFALGLDQIVLVDRPALLSSFRGPLVRSDDNRVVGRQSLGVRSHLLGVPDEWSPQTVSTGLPEGMQVLLHAEGGVMADRTAAGGVGLTLGGAIVIAGIVIAIFWSVILGIIVALIGLLAFGGFAKGRWY
jgi:hypothetical protein